MVAIVDPSSCQGKIKMITLYAFESGFGMPSSSPFVTKVMILLKMAKQPFGIEIAHDLEKAPKGKLPYIKDGDEIIADSEIIRRHLESRYRADFDKRLNVGERAFGRALARLAEEHLYWCTMYSHWQIDRHWPMIKEMFFGTLPADQRDAVAGGVRQQVLRDLHGHGMGRHSYEEVLVFARDDIDAIAEALGGQLFLFGTEPSSADAAIAPQLMAIATDPVNSPLKEAIHAQAALAPYARRVLQHMFPELSLQVA